MPPTARWRRGWPTRKPKIAARRSVRCGWTTWSSVFRTDGGRHCGAPIASTTPITTRSSRPSTNGSGTIVAHMHNLRRAFVAVALALVVAPLVANAPLFDPDEGLHAAIAQEMVQRGDYVTPTFLGAPFLDKPILFFWAEAASLRVFGNNEFAVRLPPLLFGVAGMLTVAWLGRALFGEAAALISGIAYGTMLLPFGVSQVAVHDIGVVPFMCVACWALAISSQPAATAFRWKTPALILIAGVALGLSILTKGLVGCVFATIFAACLAVRTPSALRRLAIV